MRRTIRRVGLMGLAVGAVGCNRNAVQSPSAAPAPFGAATPAGFDPTTVPTQSTAVVMKDARKANAPLRADTEVALADNAIEDAFQEQYEPGQIGARPPEARDRDQEMKPKYSKAEQDRLLDTARQRYQRALAAEPAHKGALVGLARMYAYNGDKDRAIAGYQQALQQHPKDHGLASRLAGVQIQFGEFAGAEQSARFALSLDPQNRTYQKVLGLALGHQQKWQEAGETLIAAGMAEPDAHFFLARVRLDRGDAEGGRKQIQRVLETHPQHAAAQQVAAQLDAGRPLPAMPPVNPVVAAGHSEPPR